MSDILKRMKIDFKDAMSIEIIHRNADTVKSTICQNAICAKLTIRSIISMFPQINIKQSKATDDNVIQLIKKFIFEEKSSLLYLKKHVKEKDVNTLTSKELNKLLKGKIQSLGDKLTSESIDIASRYLPKEKQYTEEEIKKWISKNIDFSSLKNKMQAMKPILQQFPSADGTSIKAILEKGDWS